MVKLRTRSSHSKANQLAVEFRIGKCKKCRKEMKLSTGNVSLLEHIILKVLNETEIFKYNRNLMRISNFIFLFDIIEIYKVVPFI